MHFSGKSISQKDEVRTKPRGRCKQRSVAEAAGLTIPTSVVKERLLEFFFNKAIPSNHLQ